jgi:cytochrome c-type biogenesis protein CcmF
MQSATLTTIGDLVFTFRGVREVAGPNYRARHDRGHRQGPAGGHPASEARHYPATQSTMTEADIKPGLTRDLYVSLGEPVDGGAWIVRVYVKPFVDWIWGGCLVMALGGLLAASDRRYRAKVRRTAEATTSVASAA